MLPLHTFAKIEGEFPPTPLKVLPLNEALKEAYPNSSVLVKLEQHDSDVNLKSLHEVGFAGVITHASRHEECGDMPMAHTIRNPEVIGSGDVVRVRPDNGQIRVLYRRGANSNTLFVTERCNSKCVMCSQPPRDEDDSWRINEILSFINLIDGDIQFLGITGGEPTLLGNDLGKIIEKCKEHLPRTGLHILTNGRTFADRNFVERLDCARGQVVWAIPLYSDLAHVHDHVVQAHHAFQDTMHGIYNLEEHGHRVEIRLVMHKLTTPRLTEYAEFIYRNLPFVHHVALMGLEPMGYAKLNHRELWIDPADYADELTKAAYYLTDRGVHTSIYNVPLCVLPREAWGLARQSISDWKNTYENECQQCSVRSSCCGFFASHGPGWKSRAIKAFGEGKLNER